MKNTKKNQNYIMTNLHRISLKYYMIIMILLCLPLLFLNGCTNTSFNYDPINNVFTQEYDLKNVCIRNILEEGKPKYCNDYHVYKQLSVIEKENNK